MCGNYCYDTHKEDEDCELNIFLCGEINDTTHTGLGGCGTGFLGENRNSVILENIYARLITSTDPDTISTPWQIGALITHEIGHCLGLLHAWENSQANLFFSGEYAITNWNDHNENFCSVAPTADCSNNNMAYSGNMKWLNPLQVAHIHRLFLGSWRSKLLQVEYDASKTITITGTEEWEYGKVIYGDIIIKPGSSLTIGCKVIMPPGGRIIVEEGGRLFVDDGLITMASNKCNENGRWEGIEVHGNRYTPQNPSDKGWVTIINSTIEHANCAIRLYDFSDKNDSGGVVNAFDSNFLNNAVSIDAGRYDEFDNTSIVMGCTFTINDDYFEMYSDTGKPSFKSHVDLKNIKRFTFSNDTFENLYTGANQFRDLKIGIKAINSSLSLFDSCIIEGFNKGIDASRSKGNHSILVTDATFNNNKIGIYGQDITVTSERNHYNIGGNAHQPVGPFIHEGIVLVECTSFSIFDNHFMSSGSGIKYGTRIVDSGEANHEVVCNYYNGIAVGNLSNGTNRNINGQEGLTYSGNEFQGHVFSIYVPWEEGGSQIGIRRQHGSFTGSPGNHFLGAFSDINNSANDQPIIDYYWNIDVAVEEPMKNIGVNLDNTFNSFDCEIMNDDGGPPDPPTTDPCPPRRTAYLSYQDQIGITKQNHDSNLDNGNTTNMLSLVNNGTVENASNVLQQLHGFSPWLSEDVGLALLNRTDIFRKNQIYNILKQNPDLLHINQIINRLFEPDFGLTVTSFQNKFLNHLTIETPRTVELRTMNHLSIQSSRLVNNAIRCILAREVIDYDELRVWLTSKGDLKAHFDIVDTYIAEENYQSARNYLQQLSNVSNWTDIQLAYYQDFRILKELIMDVLESNRVLDELTIDEQDQVILIADKIKGAAAIQAQALLNNFYGTAYFREPIFDDLPSEGLQQRDENVVLDISSTKYSRLAISPNPANQIISIDYNLEKNQANATLQLFDMNGRLLKEEQFTEKSGSINWDISKLPKGLCFYHL